MVSQHLSGEPLPESGKQDVEREIWAGNYSARDMIGYWVGGAVGVLAGSIVVALLPGQAGWAWLVYFIVALALWAWLAGLALYRKLSDHYVLTTQRLKHRSGILFRQSNRIELIDIDDVMYRQGPVQALLGVGRIHLISSDASHPSLVMNGIADVQQVADLIDDARREERRKRGLHIESI